MTEREALKLALEALQNKFLFIAGDGEAIDQRAKAITAIKEALAEQDSKDKEQAKTDSFVRQLDEALAQPWEKFCDSNCVWTDHHPDCKLAQPAVTESHKQEPVAWRNAAIRVGEDLCSVGPFGYYDMTAQQWLDWALSVVTVHAPPPQRKPLTEEEIENIANSNLCIYSFARAIEAAHGIKGEA